MKTDKKSQAENEEVVLPVGEMGASVPEQGPATKLGKIKSESDVKSVTSQLKEILGEGAVVTVSMPVSEYDTFASNSAELSENQDYSALNSQVVTNSGGTGTTITENGITLNISPRY